jgi:hypothetical protein
VEFNGWLLCLPTVTWKIGSFRELSPEFGVADPATGQAMDAAKCPLFTVAGSQHVYCPKLITGSWCQNMKQKVPACIRWQLLAAVTLLAMPMSAQTSQPKYLSDWDHMCKATLADGTKYEVGTACS